MLLHVKEEKKPWDVFEIDDDCLYNLMVTKDETGKESLSELAKSDDGEILVRPHFPLYTSYDISRKHYTYYFLNHYTMDSDGDESACEEFRMSRKDFNNMVKETGIKSIVEDLKKGK